MRDRKIALAVGIAGIVPRQALGDGETMAINP
jgi:hypothetical protein